MGWVYSGLEHQDLKRTYSDRGLLRRIIRDIKPFKFWFFFIVFSVIISTLVNLFSPLFLGNALNGLSEGSSDEQFILTSAGVFMFSYVVLFILYFAENYGMAKMVPDFMVNLRSDVFNSLQDQDLKFFDKMRSGRLTSRVGSDAAEVGNIIILLSTFLGSMMLLGLTYVILLALSTALALMTLMIIPFVVIITWMFRSFARKISRQYRKSIASVNAAIAESVEGIQIAKSYGRERETVSKFKEVNDENYRTGLKQGIILEFIFPTVDFFSVLVLWIIIQWGGIWAADEVTNITVAGMIIQVNLNPTNLYLFYSYLMRFFFPLMQMSTFYSQLQAGFAAYERIVEVRESEAEVKQNPDGLVIENGNFKGHVEFRNVTFAYETGKNVLENFNLTLNPGERLAIVGHTGAGKTTIANLIARFYEFQDGEILIDGHDIRSLSLKAYRKNLGIVQQEPFLFSGTVEDNIRYGNWNVSEEELMQAIKAVHADEFLQYMPEGLATEVGERGGRLSTGQRQLVCFARALLANPKILILDEATSAVDAYTEAVIQEALETLFTNRTSVVVAHRLSTIVNATRIIVLDHGKIVEEGNHNQLMEKGGKYQELYETYYKHQALEVPVALVK